MGKANSRMYDPRKPFFIKNRLGVTSSSFTEDSNDLITAKENPPNRNDQKDNNWVDFNIYFVFNDFLHTHYLHTFLH